jgi:hypothetical protein
LVAAVALLAALLADPEAPRPDSYPLVLLVQGDVSTDGGARVRRVRAGEDAAAGDFRARVVLEGVQADASTAGPWTAAEGGRLSGDAPVRVTDAFVAYRPHRALEVTAGSQRVPFTLSRQVDEADLRLPERPAFIAGAAPDFRTGVSVGSDLGLLQLRGAAMWAGTELGRSLPDSGALLAFRAVAEPIGPVGVAPWRRPSADPWYAWWRFSVGVSLLYGTLAEPRTLGVGGDAQLQWRRFTVAGEYLLLDAADRRQGAVIEPGLFLVPERLELAARGAWSRQAASADTLSTGGALTLYTWGGHIRWQAGLERTWREGASGSSGWALLRAAVVL